MAPLSLLFFLTATILSPILTNAAIKLSLSEDDSSYQMFRNILDWSYSMSSFSTGSSSPVSFSPKLELRREGPNEHTASSLRGLFAIEDIKKGETVMFHSWDAVLSYGDEGWPMCNMARTLLSEMTEVEVERNSDFMTSFVDFLRSQWDIHGDIPTNCSQGGRGMLRTIALNQPTNFQHDEVSMWIDQCELDDTDASRKVVSTIIRNEDYDVLNPIQMVINHRSGIYHNVDFYQNEEGIECVARRNVEAGSQIYLSYSNCPNCDEDDFDTLQILEKYGFIEDYPRTFQYFTLDDDDDEQKVKFRINELEHENKNNTFKIIFSPKSTIRAKHVLFFCRELDRLELIESLKKESKSYIPAREWDVVWTYHDVLTTALDQAIVAAAQILTGCEGTKLDANLDANSEQCPLLGERTTTCLMFEKFEKGSVKKQEFSMKDEKENHIKNVFFASDDGDNEENEESSDNKEEEEEEMHVSRQREKFLQNPLKPGQIQPIRWKNDRTMVSVDALRIGLPPELRKELRAFMESTGVVDAARDHLFSNPLESESITIRNLPHPDGKGSSLFQVHRPGMYHMSDNTWFDPGNEVTHEKELAALGRGHFDVILDALGNFYGKKSLTVYGVGIFALTQCNVGAGLHRDADGVGVYNILIAVELVDGADPELIVATDDESRIGELKYEYDVGVVIGGDILHGTIECDYRHKKGIRMVASVYVAEVTDDNVEELMNESSSLFPLQHDVKWINAQRGRHWGNGKTIVNDTGREAFEYYDQDPEFCSQKAKMGWCLSGTQAYDMFEKCPKTCNIYDPKFDSKSNS
mmetsp:Transcript_19416/g.44226  ORF Transcript_19416/g.44226 Transcript_19416/m.44226 type:complete len:808 (-) Transcript_19416:260-2683(-)